MDCKRELPCESDASTDPLDSSSEGGEAVESDMKRLRVAYNYDGAHGLLWAGEAIPVDVNRETLRARAVRGNYAEVNAMLREMHYLRQLRKFQAERGRTRTSYLEQHVDHRVPPLKEGANRLKRRN